MKVEIEYQDDVTIVKPYGRIDTMSSEEFAGKLDEALEKDTNIVIDLNHTDYISSSGLRVFLGAKRKFNGKGTFSIINVNPSILEVFEMTGFTELFQIETKNIEGSDIKAIFFDIDGTLLSYKTGIIPESTIRAIRKVQEKGIKVIIATGRDLVEMRKLPLNDISFDAYLTLNGNICLDKYEKMFAGNEIDPGEVEILVSIFEAGKLPFVLIGENKRYINYVDDTVIKTQMATNGTIPNIGEYNGEKIYQCLAFVDNETRQKLDDLLDHCAITSWHDTGIDIIAKTGGKAAGIQKFIDEEGLSRTQTMAFGDGENDKMMLEYAGIGVAMGNATESLKKEADYVTADIDDDGVAKALLHFGLIDEI